MDMTEWYYILQGVGMMIVCRQDEAAFEKHFPVNAGDLIIINRGEYHKLINAGDKPLVHLVFCTPPFNPKDVHLQEAPL
jgi:oxalate decarboxylase/phosphoglucose isomerase-like protein (cupin superfamily)